MAEKTKWHGVEEEEKWYDAHERLEEIYSNCVYSILSEYKRKIDTDEVQDWSVVSFRDLQVLWEEYVRTGLVLKRKLFEKVLDRIVENAVRLRINTELCGHTQIDPENILEDYEFDGLDLEKNYMFFVDKACGQWRISDYAMEKVYGKVTEILMQDTEEKQLPLIDQILNLVHCRSDLASWFVEGGSSSLNKLSGKE